MARIVLMPKWGMLMTQGRIIKWHKAEGEPVEKDEPLYEVETEKVTSQVEAPEGGTLIKIMYPEGSVVPCFEPIAVIGRPGEDLPTEAKQALQKAKQAESNESSSGPAIELDTPVPIVAASPSARRLAREKNIDLTKVVGTGPGGRITTDDVERVSQKRELQAEDKSFALGGLRKEIAERITKSYREAPHVALYLEMDMSKVKEHLSTIATAEGSGGVHVTYTDVFVKAVAVTLRDFPEMNAIFDSGVVRVMENRNIGIAVEVSNCLIIPVIRKADEKTLLEIAESRSQLVEKARSGKLMAQDVLDGTFTVSNLGMYGIDYFAPIINPPQVSILGIGRIVDKPVVIEGEILKRPMVVMSLSFDHRVLDGAMASRFLAKLKVNLESSDWS